MKLPPPIQQTPKQQGSRPQTALPADVLSSVDRIVLTGFMGSGKTTVGRLLAARLGWVFLDLDHEIERLAESSVPEIFAQRGEPEFRRLESLALAGLLEKSRVVLALGGGAPEVAENMRLLEAAPRAAIVHLTAPFDVLVRRCLSQEGATERPVLADLAAARERFALRHQMYEAIADHSLDTSSLNEDETLAAILEAMRGAA